MSSNDSVALKLNGELTTALIGLANDLDDYRDAGGESLHVVKDIVALIHAVCAQREAAIRANTPSGDNP